MDWIHVDKELPDTDKRILVYSPIYEGIDMVMLFRIINSRFLSTVTEVKYWTYLIPPEKENGNGN